MKRLLLLTLLVLSFSIATPVLASDGHTCTHDMTKLESLDDCVLHALKMEHLDSKGVAESFLAKIAAAQAALDREQPEVAVNVLGSLVNALEAQAGKHFNAEHAGHMINHVEMVITALEG